MHSRSLSLLFALLLFLFSVELFLFTNFRFFTDNLSMVALKMLRANSTSGSFLFPVILLPSPWLLFPWLHHLLQIVDQHLTVADIGCRLIKVGIFIGVLCYRYQMGICVAFVGHLGDGAPGPGHAIFLCFTVFLALVCTWWLWWSYSVAAGYSHQAQVVFMVGVMCISGRLAFGIRRFKVFWVFAYLGLILLLLGWLLWREAQRLVI